MAVLTERNIEKFMTGELALGGYLDRVRRVADAAGIVEPLNNPRLIRAMVAMEAGFPPDYVARYLDWRDFEGFCARLMAARGFSVTLDLRLNRPRAQVDILARSSSLALLVDCKHWARERGRAGLSAVIERQIARAGLVRRVMEDVEPMAVVVLSLAEERPRYLGGAAVVPVRALGDFLDNVLGYSADLTLY
jgi:hypothetical protein